MKRIPTLVVVGAGNTGLMCALAAKDYAGSSLEVVVVETGPDTTFGCGNSKHVEVMRVCHEEGYGETDYMNDIISRAIGDKAFAEVIAKGSRELLQLFASVGVEFEIDPSKHWAAAVSDPTGRRLGAIVNEALLRRVQTRGVHVRFGCRVEEPLVEDGTVVGVRLSSPSDVAEIVNCDVLVLSCGGFAANRALLSRHISQRLQEVKVRGSATVKGDWLKWCEEGPLHDVALSELDNFRCSLMHADSPTDDFTENRVNMASYGILVDTNGRRFIDEAMQQQPLCQKTTLEVGEVYVIFDQALRDAGLGANLKNFGLFERCKSAKSAEDLSRECSMPDLSVLKDTLTAFNTAVLPDGTAPNASPPKSAHATRLDPASTLFAYKVVPTVDYTSGGIVCRWEDGSVLRKDGTVFRGMYAAGDIASLRMNMVDELQGIKSVRNMVTGSLAGRDAADYILKDSRGLVGV